MKGTVARVAAPAAFALLVLAAWQVYVGVSGISSASLPAPTEIARSVWDNRETLLSNGFTTLTEIVLGYLIAVLIGVGLAVVLVTSRLAERAVYPWLVVSQTIPVFVLAPIFVIWTGFDIRPKLMVIALVTFFPIAVNTVDGLRSTDPELLDLLRTLGATRWRRFRIAQLPAAMPFMFSGLKIAAVLSVVGAVFAEWVGSTGGGLGYLVLVYNNQTATADMFAAVVALSVIGIGLFFLVAGIERVALPWYYEARSERA
jgi:ABC-type nitrate/sulfonate/bicarbonate transport system permease component